MIFRFYLFIAILSLGFSSLIISQYYDYINPVKHIAPTLGISKLESEVDRMTDIKAVKSSYLKTLESFRQERLNNTRNKHLLAYFSLFTAIASFVVIILTLRKANTLKT